MKKFKLFTTIASLCLACALLVFGVYAAGQATIGVSSNIKYDVTGNIAGALTVKSYASVDGIAYDSSKPMEEFAATVNATMTESEAGDIDATEATQKDSVFTSDTKFVIYVIEFAETTSTNATIKVQDIVLNRGETTTSQITVHANELSGALPAKTENSVNQYKLVIKLVEALNENAEFTVEFNVVVAKGA